MKTGSCNVIHGTVAAAADFVEKVRDEMEWCQVGAELKRWGFSVWLKKQLSSDSWLHEKENLMG